ncbi:serine hydrolase domain-containing protein [Cellulophaga baltica]|uniref:serine hydrolase domain-containing protein n=1 Tax=Cellulophaga baltica TaxID=76594 RepID=UPI0004017019|nr:serine hydrolase domain-containing protein [Cellulophaga baltica]AIY13189.1 D-alanyl-D-alanine carboxypeptidase [Cellulophaga baltica NN016038]
MKKPFLSYFKDFFAFKRVIGDDVQLQGLVKADALLSHLVTAHKIPGIAISVLKNGAPYFQKGYGFADLENQTPIHPETSVFRIASVSKPIAATALAHMVAEGLIDLDTSFYTYVPYFPKKKWDFTIRQLASHTAGIRGYLGKEYALNKPYSIKESITVFKDADLLFKPGTGYHYNSYDWVLISLAMQEASGIPFEDYVSKKVVQPLGLNSVFPADRSGVDHIKANKLALTTFYSKRAIGFRPAVAVNNYYKLAGGGYLATATDIAKLGQAYLDKKVLDETTLMQFITSELLDDAPTYYGLGWQVSQDAKGRSYYGHIGNGVGGYSNFFVYPKQNVVIAMLINCTNPNVQETLDQVIHEVLESSLPTIG